MDKRRSSIWHLAPKFSCYNYMMITRNHVLLTTLGGEQRLSAMTCCKILPSGLRNARHGYHNQSKGGNLAIMSL